MVPTMVLDDGSMFRTKCFGVHFAYDRLFQQTAIASSFSGAPWRYPCKPMPTHFQCLVPRRLSFYGCCAGCVGHDVDVFHDYLAPK